MLSLVHGARDAKRDPISQAERLKHDTLACGSPKGLRIPLQQYDFMLQERQMQKSVACSAVCANAALFAGFAPALIRAGHHGFAVVSSEATAACQAEGAQALGALFGLAGLMVAGYALYEGTQAAARELTRMDVELEELFAHAPGPEQDTSHVRHLMSRYDALPPAHRDRIKEVLFDRYLDSKARSSADEWAKASTVLGAEDFRPS